MPQFKRVVVRNLLVSASIPAAVGLLACGPTTPPGTGGTAGSGGSSSQLPCAISDLVRTRCQLCHSASPQFGAPMPLVTYADLTATRNGSKVYDLMMTRVTSTNPATLMPPPPNARLTDTEVSTLRNWIQGGAQSAAQGTTCTGGTGGTGGTGSLPADCQQTYKLRAHGAVGENDTTPFTVPTSPDKGNKYMCFYFRPPYGPGSQALALRSLFDKTNLKYLHHWILYGRDTASHTPGTFASCSATEVGGYFIGGWAPGSNPLPLPSDVGVALPPPSGELILEIHYFNGTNDVGQTDGTGVEFCTAPANTRPHTAGISSTGTEGICIEPYSSKEVVGNCSPRTDLGDIHIVGLFPHMHQTANRMMIEINRANGTRDILHDAEFSFASQSMYGKDAILHPGDTMKTHCYYQNPTAERIHFGQRTSDEMCVGFVTAWPLGALENPGGVGIGQPAHRCQGQLDILQSCNGLADLPQPVP